MAEKWQLKAVLSANAESMIRALGNVNKVARTSRKYLLDIGKSAGKLSASLGMPVGLLGLGTGALSVAGIKAIVGRFVDMSDEAVNMSKSMGVAIDEFQRLKYIAGQTDVPVDALSASVGRLNKNIAEAAAGKNKDMAALFKRAGISMRDAEGNLRSGAEVLPEIAGLFERNKNAALQARMGNVIFGKSWQSLAPLLNEGRTGIEAMTQRYKELGLAISGDALEAGEAFGDKLADLRAVASSYGTTIASKLMPVLNPMIDKLTKWLVANRELIATKVSEYIGDLAKQVAEFDWQGMVDGAKELWGWIRWLVDAVGGAKNAFIGLVIFMNRRTIAAFVSLLGSLGRAVGWFGKLAVSIYTKGIPALMGYTTAAKAAEAATDGAIVKSRSLLSLFGSLALAAAPLAAIWGVKEWAEDTSHDQERIDTLKGWSDSLKDMLPAWAGDPRAADRARYEAARADLTVPPAKVGGRIDVRFEGAPPGMRVEPAQSTGPLSINTDVGYRSFATGMP